MKDCRLDFIGREELTYWMVDNEIHIKNGSMQLSNVGIQLYDLNGNKFMNYPDHFLKPGLNSFNIGNLKNMIYFLEIRKDNTSSIGSITNFK